MLRSGSTFSLLEVLREQAPLLASPSPEAMLNGQGLLEGLPACVANEQHPEQVRRVCRTVARTGADIVLTNTGDAQLPRLEPHGLEERCEALNNSGRALLQEALGSSVIHAGHLRALPTDLPQQLREQAYGNQAVYLSDTQADLLWLTGVPNPAEAELAVRTIRRVSHTELVLHVKVDSVSDLEALLALHQLGATYLGVEGTLDQFKAHELGEWVEQLGILGLDLNADSVPLSETPDLRQRLSPLLEAGLAFLGGTDLRHEDFRRLQGVVADLCSE